MSETTNDYAFDEPVYLAAPHLTVRTVGEATAVVQGQLSRQFTVARLNALLTLERAATGSELAEARRQFCLWAQSEQLI
jgi:hypothetical protein